MHPTNVNGIGSTFQPSRASMRQADYWSEKEYVHFFYDDPLGQG